jgi:HK97 family phage major capsid protein
MSKVELDLKPDLSTPDGLRKHTLDITRHLNELQLKQQKGRVVTEDEWNNVDDGLKQLAGRTQSLDDAMKAERSNYPGPNGEERFLLDKASLRLDTPEEMPRFMRDYFNVAVMRWDELASLAHLGAERIQSVGLSEDIARAASSTNSGRLRDKVMRFQTLNDELLVTDTLLHPGASRQPDLHARMMRMQSYKKWPEYKRLVNDLCDAMKIERTFNETTGSAGLAWVPTILSAQLMDLVQVWSRVAPLFTPITMTSKVLDWPVLGSDLTAYLMSEATTEATDSTGVSASTATTNKVTFTAQKLGVRTFATAEIIEDSVVAMVPFIIQNAAKVLARGIEDAIINGDTAGTMDTLATFNPAGNPKRAWMGLRQQALVTGSYPAKSDAGAAAATAAKLIDLTFLMGAWGASPAPLAFITGFHGLKSLMKQTEFLTLEKFGSAATVLTGQIGAILGSPVIVSEFVTETDATGIKSTTVANNVKGEIICVHRESYGLATRRGINVNGSTDRYIELDQVIFVATCRNDFKPFYVPSATVTPVGLLYNIS